MAAKSHSGGSKNFKIVLNSPVILTFSLFCIISLFLSWVTKGTTNELFFSVYRSSLANPLTYVRFFGHVIGHANLSHLVNNLMLILVLGPLLEEKYGSKCLLFVMIVTAAITGIAFYIFFPSSSLCGASGIVFAFILLASITGFRDREIPLTFILVAILYLGQQVYEGIFVADNVSQLTHIIGGIVGSVIGYKLQKK